MKLAISPAGAAFRGLAAGVVGTLGMSLFWRLTKALRPGKRSGEYAGLPERQQRSEGSTETLARRTVEGVAQRGPLDRDAKKRGGQLIHYGFGAMWGAIYGLARESLPFMRSPLGMSTFGSAVWLISEGIILPVFKLSPPLYERDAKNIGYYFASHLVYGGAVATAYEALRPATWLIAGSWAGAKLMKRSVHKRAPALFRPVADKLIDGTSYTIRKVANLPPLSKSL